MKCPHCQKEMKREKDIIKEDGVEFMSFSCSKCKEELMTLKDLKVVADKYRKLKESREITFSKWGNSLALRIPKDVADHYHLKEGVGGRLFQDKDGIKILPD